MKQWKSLINSRTKLNGNRIFIFWTTQWLYYLLKILRLNKKHTPKGLPGMFQILIVQSSEHDAIMLSLNGHHLMSRTAPLWPAMPGKSRSIRPTCESEEEEKEGGSKTKREFDRANSWACKRDLGWEMRISPRLQVFMVQMLDERTRGR